METKYHVIAVKVDREGRLDGPNPRTYMTAMPVTHAEACTIVGKIAVREGRDIRLEPVGPHTDDLQTIIDLCSATPREANVIRSEAALLLDLDNEEGHLVSLVRGLLERVERRHTSRFSCSDMQHDPHDPESERGLVTLAQLLTMYIDEHGPVDGFSEAWASTCKVGDEITIAGTGERIRRVR